MDPKNPFRGSPRAIQPRPAEPTERPLLDAVVVEHLRGQLLAAFREGDADHAAKTEEAANIARLAEAYAAIGRADWEALAKLLSDDVEMAILGAPGTPFVGHWRGRDKVVTATRNNISLVSDQRPRILWVTGQGNQVMVGTVESGIFRSTGKRYEVHWMQVFRFRNGQIFYFREFCDSASLIAAAR